MRIGIISEGHADRAVITNALIGSIGVDDSEIVALRPIYNLDETDKALTDKRTFSSWSVIKEECEKRELIDGFLAIEDQDFIVIHIDTAEASDYGVERPSKKSQDYCLELRNKVIEQIAIWLNEDLSDSILHAVAIEEIEAWILTIYEQKDSSKSASPKERMDRVLGKLKINTTSNYENFLHLSKPLSKKKEISKGKFLSYNSSLKAFFEEVETKCLK